MTDYGSLFPDRRLEGATVLRQCQLVMSRMLKIFDHICAHHDIDYWMTAGTLIGAIRHQGFVPWDGDIDVGITAEGAARFAEVAHELPDDIFYQDSQTDPAYQPPLPLVKLRDRFSNYVEFSRAFPDANWHNGLQVDVIIYHRDADGRLINPFRDTRYSPDEILPTVPLEFEGALLQAPAQYDRYIRRRYGNYLVLPEPDKRVAHEGAADPISPCNHPASLQYK